MVAARHHDARRARDDGQDRALRTTASSPKLLDAKGDLRGALRYYEAFLGNWTNPEPEQAVTVRTVKARVAELRAKLSPG